MGEMTSLRIWAYRLAWTGLLLGGLGSSTASRAAESMKIPCLMRDQASQSCPSIGLRYCEETDVGHHKIGVLDDEQKGVFAQVNRLIENKI